MYTKSYIKVNEQTFGMHPPPPTHFNGDQDLGVVVQCRCSDTQFGHYPPNIVGCWTSFS